MRNLTNDETEYTFGRNLSNDNGEILSFDLSANLPLVYTSNTDEASIIGLKGLNALGSANQVLAMDGTGTNMIFKNDSTIDLDTAVSYSSQAASDISFGNPTTLRKITMHTGEFLITSGSGVNNDCILKIQADKPENNDYANPEIQLLADGDTTQARIFLDDNDLKILHSQDYAIQLGANGATQLIIDENDVKCYRSHLSVSAYANGEKPRIFFAPFQNATDFGKYLKLEVDINDVSPIDQRTLIMPNVNDTIVCKATTDTLTNKTIYNAIYDGDAGTTNARLQIQDSNKTHKINILAQDLNSDVDLTLGDISGTIAIQSEIPTNTEIKALFSATNPITYSNGAIGWTNSENYITLTSLETAYNFGTSTLNPVTVGRYDNNKNTDIRGNAITFSQNGSTFTLPGASGVLATTGQVPATSANSSNFGTTAGANITLGNASYTTTINGSSATINNAIFTGTTGAGNPRLTIKSGDLNHNAFINCINFTADRTFYLNDDGGTILTSNTTSPNVSKVQNYSNDLPNGTTINFGSGGTSLSETRINNITFGCANTFTFGSGKGANGDCVLNIVSDTDDATGYDTSNPELRLTADGGGNVARFYLDNNDLKIIHEDDYDIQIGANNTTQLKLNNADVEVYKSALSISSTGSTTKPVLWFVPHGNADNFSKSIQLEGDITNSTSGTHTTLTLPRTTATLSYNGQNISLFTNDSGYLTSATSDIASATSISTSAASNITIGNSSRTITMNATNYTYNDTDGTAIFQITNSDVEINGADFGIKARSSSIPPAIYFWDYDKSHYVSLKGHAEIASSVVLTLPHITATLAYTGQNVSSFTNDAGYLTSSSITSAINVSTDTISGNPQRNFGNNLSQYVINASNFFVYATGQNIFDSANSNCEVVIKAGDTASDSYSTRLTFYTKGNTKRAEIFKNTGDEFVIKNIDERLELGGENDIQLKMNANDLICYKSDFTISAYTATAYPRIFFLPNANADNYTNRICLNSYQTDTLNNGSFDVYLLPFNSDLCQSRSGTSSTRYLNFWTSSNTNTKLRQDVYGCMSEGNNGSDSGNRAYSFSVRSTGVSSSYFPYIYNQSNGDGKHFGFHTNAVGDNFMVEQGQDIRYYNTDLIGDTNTGHGYSKLCLGDIYCQDIFADDVKSDGVLLTSDRRLKKDIKPIENALSTINKLECKTFLKKINPQDDIFGKEYRLDSGFIAQDLYNDVPELQHIVNGVETDISSNFVNGKLIDDCVGYKIIQTSNNTCVPCDLDPSGNANPHAGEPLTESTYEKVLDPNKRLSLNYEEIIPYCCRAIQELDSIVKQQQEQISQQQVIIDKLISSNSFKEFKS